MFSFTYTSLILRYAVLWLILLLFFTKTRSEITSVQTCTVNVLGVLIYCSIGGCLLQTYMQLSFTHLLQVIFESLHFRSVTTILIDWHNHIKWRIILEWTACWACYSCSEGWNCETRVCLGIYIMNNQHMSDM